MSLLAMMVVVTADVSAAPFEVRRAVSDPSVVQSMPIHAMTMSAPFDDADGVLSDGNTYYYLVDDMSGNDVLLSVNKNSVANTVRLSFDDGDPWSANVDPWLSSVTATPTTFPADGVSFATLVIVPRDTDGVPLGTGLSVTIDAFLLAPGFVSGPIVDHGNGSYSVQVVSWSAGFGDAVVTVEGVVLGDEPQLTFETAVQQGPPNDLEQIALELTAIAGENSVPVERELERAVENFDQALAELYAAPPDIEKALFWISHGLDDLADANGSGWDSALLAVYSQRLAEIAGQLARYAVHVAVTAGGDAVKLDAAHAHLADADAAFAAGDYAAAVTGYHDAAKEAEVSLG